ncbi:uncharacterized protein GGS22DRAFT_123004 [Annulohypoxylon maeteangense]|uniref:uncharacterized protein n=1 Tax=Annulohypoxylon maeteangense TaxID=1927788 RepID=UPI0020078E98|nr:uncharacterized protein GGS22DRAFT_123004 [Annulohypoxylon maeteangense]KAI0886040.1 hypothetical protein GGS22DRAFT_123004 [Annulohypoxylon maeteangense]
MLTMTRLPSDSFLPSGGMLDHTQRPISFVPHSNGHSSASIISPLSLPHSINQLSYIDESHLSNLPPPNYSHSPSLSAAPQSQQQSLSPRRSPLNNPEQRLASLSSTKNQAEPGVTSPPDNMSTNNLVDLLRCRDEQNKKMIELWRAERAQLEANRDQAEELYQGERALMDQERKLWEQEKARIQNELLQWQRRVTLLEQDKYQLIQQNQNLSIRLRGTQGRGSQATRSFDGSTDTTAGSIRGGGLGSPGSHSQSTDLPPSSSEGTSPNTAPSASTMSNLLLGSTMPDSQPFIPLDPRMQGPSPGVASPKTQEERIPSIDIQEVMPGLEGIRVRTNAVQKTTFTDEKPLSPPAGLKKLSPSTATKQDPGRTRVVPAELTKEALQAPESDRLTMHAGHTPNHSMSLSRLHTVDSTAATNTSNSSGTQTPKNPLLEVSQGGAVEQSAHGQPACDLAAVGTCMKLDVGSEPAADRLGPLPVLIPREHDPELKGPLQLRNLPAADEPFLKALSDKLEQVITNNLSPTVLEEQAAEPKEFPELNHEKPTQAGGDGAQDAQVEPVEEEDEEIDIPLKLKPSNNFGAPLGQLRKQGL